MTEPDQIQEPTRMDLLKDQAKALGIDIRGNISEDTLKARIDAKLAGTEPPSNDNPEPNLGNPMGSEDAPAAKTVSKSEAIRTERLKQQREQLKLIRVRIVCLNPMKKDLEGEIVTVANGVVGSVRKFIPFGEASENGYHIPQILLTELQSRKFNQIRTKKGINGTISADPSRLVPEFAIEILPPLTQDELTQLARTQAAAAGATTD